VKNWLSGFLHTRRSENDMCLNFSVVACVFLNATTLIASRCLVTIGDTHTDADCWEGIAKHGLVHRHRQRSDLISLL
jgi:hypothetical protein